MGLLSYFRSSFGGPGAVIVGSVAPDLPLAQVRSGSAEFSTEARAAIDAASFFVRSDSDDGARVAVMSPALRGSFIYSREEAQRRLSLAFPELSDEGISRAVRHLESRVRVALNPPEQQRRRNWVQGWKED